MKKILQSFILVFVISISIIATQYHASAATFSVSKSASSVVAGGKFTVTVQLSGAGKFSISASNGTVSSQSLWVEGNGSVTVTAGQSGTVSVTVSAIDVTGYDETPVSGSKTVSVKIKSASPSQPSTSTSSQSTSTTKETTTKKTTTKQSSTKESTINDKTDTKQKTKIEDEDTRSSINTLSSLTINGGSLKPNFSANTTKYTVDVAADVTSITLGAQAKDGKATVSGIGDKKLSVGKNTFQIKCQAENGSTKTYTVTVNVDDKPLVYTEYNGKKLGVVRDSKDIAIPHSFEETTVKLENNDIIAYHSNLMDKTIVYLEDENNQKDFYLYEKDKGIISIFTPITILGRNLFVVDLSAEQQQREGMKYQELTIDNNQLMGWIYEDEQYSQYSLITVMNEQGKLVTYQYEKTEDSLQLYLEPKKDIQSSEDILLRNIFIGVSIILSIVCIGLIIYIRRFKKKSIAVIKSYYERKNQG